MNLRSHKRTINNIDKDPKRQRIIEEESDDDYIPPDDEDEPFSDREVESEGRCLVCGQESIEPLCGKDVCLQDNEPIVVPQELRDKIHQALDDEYALSIKSVEEYKDRAYDPKKYGFNDTEATTLEKIKQINKQKEITVQDIIRSPISEEKKADLMERMAILQGLDHISEEFLLYRNNTKQMLITEEANLKYADKIKDLQKYSSDSQTLELRVLESQHAPHIKARIMREVSYLRNLPKTTEEYYKLSEWINYALSINYELPAPQIPPEASNEEKMRFEQEALNIMNGSLYGMEKVKDSILDFLFEMISAPNSREKILALCGPPGCGKTTVADIVGRVLNKYVKKIQLGGATDGTKLRGHGKTYLHSVPGDIVMGLCEARSGMLIYYIDEIDKIQGHNGKRDNGELNGALIHVLDPAHNHEFVDDYLGFPVNISNSIFILSFNNRHGISSELLDRLTIIDIPGYQIGEKVQIAKKHLIPQTLQKLQIPQEHIIFPDEVLKYLIRKRSQEEEGVRQLKRDIKFVATRLNRYRQTGKAPKGITVGFPIEINEGIIDILFEGLVRASNSGPMYS
jgi:hypothetical protein